jgi:hypothetical protein
LPERRRTLDDIAALTLLLLFGWFPSRRRVPPVTDETQTQDEQEVNPDEDRYPDARRVLAELLDGDYLPDGPIHRIDVNLSAGGEAAARWWPARAEDPEFTVIRFS